MNKSMRLLYLALFVIILNTYSAFAEHAPNGTLLPSVSPPAELVPYTVDICNAGPDPVDEVRIIKNPEYTTFECENRTDEGWELVFVPVWFEPGVGGQTQMCWYFTFDSDSFIDGGECDEFDFNATTPDNESCELPWKFETRDQEQETEGDFESIFVTTSVDGTEPNFTKHVIGPQEGPCPPGQGEECWISTETIIEVWVEDPGDQICNLDQNEIPASGMNHCNATVILDDNFWSFDTYFPGDDNNSIHFNVSWNEDSRHVLTIECVDNAGNMLVDTEVFRVDNTPARTTHEFNGPQYNDGLKQWIDSVTTVDLTPSDPDPTGFSCNVGVDKTWYINVLAMDVGDTDEDACHNPPQFCNELNIPNPYDGILAYDCINEVQDLCTLDLGNTSDWFECVETWAHMTCGVDERWKLYRGDPIPKENESCHILQYFSIDHLDNKEDTNVECFFVDKTPPLVSVEVGEPKKEGNNQTEFPDANGTFYFVTPETDITLTCVDQEPHPSGADEFCFKVDYDLAGDITDLYCPLLGGTIENGFCCAAPPGLNDPFVFNFNENEDSVHNLTFFCKDRVNKTSEVETRHFKVDSTAPTITKMMFGTYMGDCPPQSENDSCSIAMDNMSGVSVWVEDGGEICHVDMNNCTYEVWWEDQPNSPVQSGNFVDHVNITFFEDSSHELVIYCEDGLGNGVWDNETFLVDSTPPNTTKTYGEPYFGCYDWCYLDCENNPFKVGNDTCMNTCLENMCGGQDENGHYYPQWITSDTKITIEADDEKSGVANISYRVTLVPDEYCESVKSCQPCVGQSCPEFTTTDGNMTMFNISQQSCHMIEHFAVDNLGLEETLRWQCTYVDNTPPTGVKTIGDPKKCASGNCTCVGDPLVMNGTNDTLPTGEGVTIFPEDLMATLSPGESVEEVKQITTDPTPIANVDVAFLFDLTQSMSQELDSTKTNAIQIMNDISANVLSAQFAVGSFMDYNAALVSCGYAGVYGDISPPIVDYPWSRDQDITSNIVDVSNVINSLNLGNGEDLPESYARALYESLHFSWRDQSKKIVIIFQDNVPHDCSIGDYGCTNPGGTTGLDPGPDNLTNTSDDITWANVITQLEAAGITVIAIDSSGGSSCQGVWQALTSATGGTLAELDNINDLPDQIVGLVENETSMIETITLMPKEGFENWVTWVPENHTNVSGNETVNFNITITVPPGTAPGEYHFYIKIVGDGSILAVQPIWITVPGGECTDVGDYFVTQNTPITIECTDAQPHPVGHTETCFKVDLGNDSITDTYCDENLTDGYCCMSGDANTFEFMFQEDSEHTFEFVCADILGNKGLSDVEKFFVETVPPVTDLEITGPMYSEEVCENETNGSNESCTNVMWIDTETRLNLDAVDPDPHPSGLMSTMWRLNRVPDEHCESVELCVPCDQTTADSCSGFQEYDGPIAAPNESCHVLEYFSSDMLGNTEDTNVKCMFVDKTPPVLEQTIGEPQYFDEEEGHLYINLQTPISADNVFDPEPHPSGVDTVEYRITLMDNDMPCWNQTLCEEAVGTGDFAPINGEVFAGEESCHLIELRATDRVNKSSELKTCVFVDDTAPVTNKTVGEPKEVMSDEHIEFGEVFYPNMNETCQNPGGCWEVTMMTPIDLTSCVDPEPHPSGATNICYQLDLDNEDITESDCITRNGTYDLYGDGYCCLSEGANFMFNEESWHRLTHYCIDNVGNIGEPDVEYFKVEGAPFNIYLYKKWNLISVPFVLQDDNPDNVFGELDKVAGVWTYDSEAGEWLVWTKGGPNSLTSVQPGWGYWLMMEDDENLTIGGSLFQPAVLPPSRQLTAGWNLIGPYGVNWQLYNKDKEKSFMCGDEYIEEKTDVFGSEVYCSLGSLVDTQQGYPRWSSLWSYVNCGDHIAGWSGLNTCVEDFNMMYAGRGYWVELDVDDIYAPATTCVWNADNVCVDNGIEPLP